MGTSSKSLDPLTITHTLTACKNLHEFDQRLSHELKEVLPCDLVGFYLYSQSTQTFAPISAPLTDPNCPGYMIGQLPADGTMKETAVRQGRAILTHSLADSPWTEAVGLKTAPFTTASVIVAPLIESAFAADQPARTVAVMTVVAPLAEADAAPMRRWAPPSDVRSASG